MIRMMRAFSSFAQRRYHAWVLVPCFGIIILPFNQTLSFLNAHLISFMLKWKKWWNDHITWINFYYLYLVVGSSNTITKLVLWVWAYSIPDDFQYSDCSFGQKENQPLFIYHLKIHHLSIQRFTHTTLNENKKKHGLWNNLNSSQKIICRYTGK